MLAPTRKDLRQSGRLRDTLHHLEWDDKVGHEMVRPSAPCPELGIEVKSAKGRT